MNGGNGIGLSWPFATKERAKLEYSILPYYLIALAFEVGKDKLANYISLQEGEVVLHKSYGDLCCRIACLVSSAIRWTRFPEFSLWDITGISKKAKEVVDRLIQDFDGWSPYEVMNTYPKGVMVDAVRRFLKEK